VAEEPAATSFHRAYWLRGSCLRTRGWTPWRRASVSTTSLPGRLGNSWNLAAQSETAETQAADSEFAQISSRPSANFAAIVPASRELRPRLLLCARRLELLLDICVLNSFCSRQISSLLEFQKFETL